METIKLIEELENMLMNTKTLPMTNKIIIDRDVIIKRVNDIRKNMPLEIGKAMEIMNKKKEILADAQEQADLIVKEANDKIKTMVDESQIVKMIQSRSNEIISNAQSHAREIRQGGKEYANEILNKLEKYLEEILNTVKENIEELKKF